jgi:hypothetical protein
MLCASIYCSVENLASFTIAQSMARKSTSRIRCQSPSPEVHIRMKAHQLARGLYIDD